jgi:hypothetical protein
VLNVYTMDQVHAFDEAAKRNVALDLIETATAFRLAADPKGTAWKKYVDHLANRSRRTGKTPKAPHAVMTRAQAAELRKMSTRRAN